MPYLKASAGRILVLDPDLLSPKYDYDFTHVTDDGKTYERGGHTLGAWKSSINIMYTLCAVLDSSNC